MIEVINKTNIADMLAELRIQIETTSEDDMAFGEAPVVEAVEEPMRFHTKMATASDGEMGNVFKELMKGIPSG